MRLIKNGEGLSTPGRAFLTFEKCSIFDFFTSFYDLWKVINGTILTVLNLPAVFAMNSSSMIYPGHGKPGSIDLLQSQKKYLLAYSGAVKELSDGKSTLTEGAKKELTQRMEKFLLGAGLSFLIALSADRVAEELSGIK